MNELKTFLEDERKRYYIETLSPHEIYTTDFFGVKEHDKRLIQKVLEIIEAHVYKHEQWDRDEHYPLEIIYTNGLKKLLNEIKLT